MLDNQLWFFPADKNLPEPGLGDYLALAKRAEEGGAGLATVLVAAVRKVRLL